METAVWFRIPNSPLRYLRILCAFALSSESPNYSLPATRYARRSPLLLKL